MTRIYGASDDLIEIEGDMIQKETYCYNEQVMICSDGTEFLIGYGLKVGGVWGITVLGKGELFSEHIECYDPDSEIYSDELIFNDGIEWIAVKI